MLRVVGCSTYFHTKYVHYCCVLNQNSLSLYPSVWDLTHNVIVSLLPPFVKINLAHLENQRGTGEDWTVQLIYLSDGLNLIFSHIYLFLYITYLHFILRNFLWQYFHHILHSTHVFSIVFVKESSHSMYQSTNLRRINSKDQLPFDKTWKFWN